MFARVLVAALLGVPSPAAAKLKYKGEAALETRAYGGDDEPATEDYGLAGFGRLELGYKKKPFRFKLRGYGRFDVIDPERAVLVPEEAWAELKINPFRLRVGFDIVNWTATEAFHPADVLNSRNLDSDAENYEKVGEPMAMLSVKVGTGSISAYYMPVLMHSILGSPNSRLAFAGANPFTGARTAVEERVRLDHDGDVVDGDFAHQGALRVTQSFGGADLGVHVIHHMDRHQPEIRVDPQKREPVAVYRTVTQVGGTYAHAIEGVVLKVEAAYRWFHPRRKLDFAFGPLLFRDHAQVAVGAEYGLSHESGAESTLLAEAQAIIGVGDARAAALNIFQRDVLVGYRFAFNDVDSRELFASVIFDVQREEEVLAAVSYRQRIGDVWTVEAGLRFVFAEQKGPFPVGLELLDDADEVRITVTRHF